MSQQILSAINTLNKAIEALAERVTALEQRPEPSRTLSLDKPGRQQAANGRNSPS